MNSCPLSALHVLYAGCSGYEIAEVDFALDLQGLGAHVRIEVIDCAQGIIQHTAIS